MNKLFTVCARCCGAVLIVSAMLFASCSFRAVPKNVPQVKGVEIPNLAGVSLLVRNAEKDAWEYTILTDKGVDLGFAANRQERSKKFVEAPSRELAKQGAQVRSNAPLMLNVSLPRITMAQYEDAYTFSVKTVVASSARGSKTYDASAESHISVFDSVDSMANRLAGQVLSEAIKVMLTDAEFLAQLTKKQ